MDQNITINLNGYTRARVVANDFTREPPKRVVLKQILDISRSLATAKKIHKELLRKSDGVSYISCLTFQFHHSLHGSQLKYLDVTLRRFDWYSTNLKQIDLINYCPTKADLALWKWTCFPNLKDWKLSRGHSKSIMFDETIKLCALMSDYTFRNGMTFKSRVFMKYCKHLIAMGKQSNIWKNLGEIQSLTMKELRIYLTLFARDNTKSKIKSLVGGVLPMKFKKSTPERFMALESLKENSISLYVKTIGRYGHGHGNIGLEL